MTGKEIMQEMGEKKPMTPPTLKPKAEVRKKESNLVPGSEVPTGDEAFDVINNALQKEDATSITINGEEFSNPEDAIVSILQLPGALEKAKEVISQMEQV